MASTALGNLAPKRTGGCETGAFEPSGCYLLQPFCWSVTQCDHWFRASAIRALESVGGVVSSTPTVMFTTFKVDHCELSLQKTNRDHDIVTPQCIQQPFPRTARNPAVNNFYSFALCSTIMQVPRGKDALPMPPGFESCATRLGIIRNPKYRPHTAGTRRPETLRLALSTAVTGRSLSDVL